MNGGELFIYHLELEGKYLNPATREDEKRIHKGYRVGQGLPCYDVYYENVADKYIIQERWINDRKVHSGPYIIEVHPQTATPPSLDQRCLEILKNILRRWKCPEDRIKNATIRPYHEWLQNENRESL